MAEIQNFLDPKAEAQIKQYKTDLEKIVGLYAKLDITTQKTLKRATDDFKKVATSADKLNTSLTNQAISNKGSIKDRKALNTSQKEAERINKALLSANEKLKKAQSQQNLKLTETKQKLTEVNKANRQYAQAQAEVKTRTAAGIKDAQALSGSYKRLSDRLAQQKKLAKDLGATYGTNSVQFKKAQADVSKLDKEVKKLDASTGDHQRNVGNYASAFGPLRAGIASAGVALKAFLANPVVLIVGAIVAVFALFRKALTRSEEGQARLNKIWRVMQSVIDNVLDVVLEFGIALFDTFPKKLEQVGNRFTIFFSGLKGGFLRVKQAVNDFFGDPSDELSKRIKEIDEDTKKLGERNKELGDQINAAFIPAINKVKSFGKEIRQDIKDAKALANLEAELAKIERAILVENAKLAKESGELRLQAEATKKTAAEESIKLLEKSFDLDERILQGEIKLAQARADILRRQSALAADDIAAKQGIAQAEADVFAAEGAFNEKRRERTRRLNIFRLEAFKQDKERRTAQIQIAKIQADAELRELARVVDAEDAAISERLSAVNRLAEARGQVLEDANAQELSELDKRKELALISEADYSIQVQLLRVDLANEIAKIEEASVLKQAAINEAAVAKQTATAQLVAMQATEIAQRAAEQQINILKVSRAQGLIEEEAFTEQVRAIRNKALNSEIGRLEQELDSFEGITAEKIRLEKELAIAKKRFSDQATAVTIANLEKEKEERKELNEAIKEIAIESAGIAADLFVEKNQREIEEDQKTAETKKTNAIAALDKQREANLITEQFYNEQKASIESNFDKKSRELKRKQARADKAKAIFDAVIATALAVVKSLPNIALAIVVGAFGALKTGLIAARPIPAFKKGTKDSPAGLALVGEDGRELVLGPSGGARLVSKPSVVSLKKHSTVLTNAQTERALAGGSRINVAELAELKQINKSLKRSSRQLTTKRPRRHISRRLGMQDYYEKMRL